MFDRLPRADHLSYKLHRRQAALQIILPVALAALLVCVVVVLVALAAARGEADTNRWSAVSAIWLTLPLILAGVLFSILVGGLIYLLALALKALPPYTGRAQVAAYRLHLALQRAADLTVRPVIAIQGYLATAGAIFGRRPNPPRSGASRTPSREKPQ